MNDLNIYYSQPNLLILKKLLGREGVLLIPLEELKVKKTKTLLKYEEYLQTVIDAAKMEPIIEAREMVDALIHERTHQ